MIWFETDKKFVVGEVRTMGLLSLVVTFLKLKNIQPATVVIASLKNAIPTGITTIVTIKKASDIRSQ